MEDDNVTLLKMIRGEHDMLIPTMTSIGTGGSEVLKFSSYKFFNLVSYHQQDSHTNIIPSFSANSVLHLPAIYQTAFPYRLHKHHRRLGTFFEILS